MAYNSRTDELHLLTPAARYAYLLCDGLNTVGDIQHLMDREGGGSAVSRLLGQLVERGLLRVVAATHDQAGGSR